MKRTNKTAVLRGLRTATETQQVLECTVCGYSDYYYGSIA